MKNESNKAVQMDGVCKAGCIISIVSSAIILLLTCIYGVLWLTTFSLISTPNLTPTEIDALRIARRIVGVFLIVMALLQLLPLYFSINLLRGKAQSNIPAGVIALVFSGLIGGVLILVGKYSITSDSTLSSSKNEELTNKI